MLTVEILRFLLNFFASEPAVSLSDTAHYKASVKRKKNICTKLWFKDVYYCTDDYAAINSFAKEERSRKL